MSMSKARQIFGIVLTVGVIGLTVYSIKKYYDTKKQQEQSIGIDEAKEIVAEGKVSDEELDALLKEESTKSEGGFEYPKTGEDVDVRDDSSMSPDPHFKSKTYGQKARVKRVKPDVLNNEQMTEIVDEARETAAYNSSYMEPNGKVVSGPEKKRIGFTPDEIAAMKEAEEAREEEEEVDPLLDGEDPEELQNAMGYYNHGKEGMEELRYEPNSIDARDQFIGMELASIGRDSEARDVIALLYDHPFVPTCDEDRNLKMRLIDHRVRFFGVVSKWSKEVSFGDLIMYYARSAEYNCNQDVRYWVDYFLTCGDLNNITFTSDEFDERIQLLNAHKFFNQDSDSYGLFGLTARQFTEACSVAKARIDESVTYDIEFNIFLQGVVG